MTERTWRTRDRRTLRISDMETSHIVNCVRMLKRAGCCSLDEFNSAWAYSPQGDMASYYHEQALDSMRPCHELDWFEEELGNRGVEVPA